jgi:hypothetical protein
LLAKNVNDDACQQDKHRAFKTFASKLAPTGDRCDTNRWVHTVNVGAAEGCDLLILPLLWFLILICCPFPRGRTQALRRGYRGKDAAVAAPGHGWPMAAGPRSNAGVRACRATARHRMAGQKPLVTWGFSKSLAVRAKPPAAVTEETDMPPEPSQPITRHYCHSDN